jgi:hypothetical protein
MVLTWPAFRVFGHFWNVMATQQPNLLGVGLVAISTGTGTVEYCFIRATSGGSF